MYKLEAELMSQFKEMLAEGRTPLGQFVNLGDEFYFVTGRTDLLAIDTSGDLFAFEGKLSRWRIAIHQAYRNLSYAKFSYVVLPEKSARQAIKHSRDFESYGIGLCSIASDGVRCLIPAKAEKEPLFPWLQEKAILFLENGFSYA